MTHINGAGTQMRSGSWRVSESINCRFAAQPHAFHLGGRCPEGENEGQHYVPIITALRRKRTAVAPHQS